MSRLINHHHRHPHQHLKQLLKQVAGRNSHNDAMLRHSCLLGVAVIVFGFTENDGKVDDGKSIITSEFYLGHMKNTRRNTRTGARYAMPVRVNYRLGLLINFGKTTTNPNPNPDPNRYRRRCPDPNARIQKFGKDCVS